jgi:hypothetical protein
MYPQSNSKLTIADILNSGISEYKEHHGMSYKQKKVVNKITSCGKTAEGFLVYCPDEKCGYKIFKHKSCGDRHCNKCNNYKKMKWIAGQIENLLPVPYYHVVFTIPYELNNLAICNQARIYDLFFKSAFETLNKFSSDERFLGGKLGYTGILHTWGQKMDYHPHIHFTIAGCGITPEGKVKQLPYQKKFLFPVKAMSKVFRGIFMEGLNKLHKTESLKYPGGLEKIKENYQEYKTELYKKEWVIFSKPPLPNSIKILEYLSRYSYKVAISNGRLISCENGEVEFNYKDYKDKDDRGVGKIKQMKLTEEEFIRRFMLHILPEGFRKIRYGGILSSNQKGKMIKKIREYFFNLLSETQEAIESAYEGIKKYIIKLCPHCLEKALQYKKGFIELKYPIYQTLG